MGRYKAQTESVLAIYEAQHPFLGSIKAAVLTAFDVIEASYARGGKLLLCGNGGSNADCEHIVGELGKKFLLDRPLDPVFRKALLAQGDVLFDAHPEHLPDHRGCLRGPDQVTADQTHILARAGAPRTQ